jgi:hypothetical protein
MAVHGINKLKETTFHIYCVFFWHVILHNLYNTWFMRMGYKYIVV